MCVAMAGEQVELSETVPQFGTCALRTRPLTHAAVTEGKPPFRIVAVNDSWLDTCGFTRNQVMGATAKIMYLHSRRMPYHFRRRACVLALFSTQCDLPVLPHLSTESLTVSARSQGPATEPESMKKIMAAVAEKRSVSVVITNYTKARAVS